MFLFKATQMLYSPIWYSLKADIPYPLWIQEWWSKEPLSLNLKARFTFPLLLFLFVGGGNNVCRAVYFSLLVLQKQRHKVPWSSLLLSIPVWSALICQVCSEFGFFLFLAETPTYFSNIHGFNLSQVRSMLVFLTTKTMYGSLHPCILS